MCSIRENTFLREIAYLPRVETGCKRFIICTYLKQKMKIVNNIIVNKRKRNMF